LFCGRSEARSNTWAEGVRRGMEWCCNTHGAAADQRRRSNGASAMEEEEMKMVVGHDNGNGKLCIQNPNDER